MQQLATIGLAIPADLKRCAGAVRRIARGLPTTDSVWIDALVTTRRLTLWQARQLEENHGNELILGGKYGLQSPRLLDPILSLYEAQDTGRKQAYLVSCHRTATTTAETEEALARLTNTIRSLSACKDKVPGLPIDVLTDRNSICLVSQNFEGDSLARLLVRRGRFPEDVVRNLAVELIRQLQAAEPFALHGDLRLSNLWLTRTGELVLLNWGLLNAVSPVITIHTPLPHDSGDSLAPERVELQRRALITSEIYAVGCILWQLLAGRPPFTLADPLAKITAHRTKIIPDVRTISPETSESLATLIRNMTVREPSRRLQSYSEVRQQLAGGSRPKARLQKFSRSFESVAPAQTTTRTPAKSRVAAMAATVLLTITLGLVAWQREHLGLPRLSSVEATETKLAPPKVTAQIGPEISTAALQETSATPSEAQSPTPTLQPTTALLKLPPVQDGRVTLEPGGNYAAGTLEAVEQLLITSDSKQPATIHIQDVPLIARAGQIKLEHTRVVVTKSLQQPPVQIWSETLLLEHCFIGRKETSEQTALLHWTPSREAVNNEAKTSRPNSGRLLVRDCEFVGPCDVMHLDGTLTAALFENVFAAQTRTLLQIRHGATSQLRVPLMLNACTLQNCGPVVGLPTGKTLDSSGRISLQGADSLVDLAIGEGLIEFRGNSYPENSTKHIEIAAQGIVTPQELILAIYKDPATQLVEELNSDDMMVGGLLSGSYRFEQPNKSQTGRPKLQIDALPVRYSPNDPGADTTRLPARPDGF